MTAATAFRPATPDDAAAFARLFTECWELSYGGVMPRELVERMTPEAALELWRSALAGPSSHLAALDGAGELLGFVGYRIADDDGDGDDGSGHGYVASLYVSPRAQGGGVGRELLARAEAGLRELGARTARLWVFEQNAPSRRFYERSGWIPDGSRETLPEWGEPQIGMAKDLRRGACDPPPPAASP